jgi:hypothetical protein
MRGILGSAFFWFALLLVALEALLRQALPYSHQPRANEVYRNPTDHRGWPEYLDVDDDALGGELIALLSASQAVGKEIDDPSRIYPALLRRELEGRGLRLENWASGGTRTVDIELLSMKAIARRARLVVLGFSYRNFDRPEKLNLDFPFTDVHLFAGDPRLWRYLPGTTFAPSTRAEDVLQRSGELYSSLGRSRIAVIDAVVERLPSRWHRWIVGRFVRPRQRLDAAADPAGSIFWVDQTAALAEWDAIEAQREAVTIARGVRVSAQEVDARLATFRVFLDGLTARCAHSGTRFVFVWLPMKTDLFPPPSLFEVRRFYGTACAEVERAGARCHDLHAAIPAERFLTPGHVDRRGHELLAELMLRVIDRELEGRE